MSKISVRLTPKQERVLNSIESSDDQLQIALTSAQKFLDQNEWKKGFSVFSMDGYYNHKIGKTRVLFLLINNTGKTINNFSAQLHPIATSDTNIQFSVANVSLTQEYLGDVDPEEAVLFFVDIPTRGLNEEKHFTFDEFELQMYSIDLS